MKNPYPLALPIDGMGLDVLRRGHEGLHRRIAGRVHRCRRAGRSRTRSRSRSTYADVIKVVRDYSAKDYLATAMDVNLSIPLPALPGSAEEHPLLVDAGEEDPRHQAPRLRARLQGRAPDAGPDQGRAREGRPEPRRRHGARRAAEHAGGEEARRRRHRPCRARPAGLGLLHPRGRQRGEGRPLVREARLRPRGQWRPPGRGREHAGGAPRRQVADHGREHVQLAQPLAEHAAGCSRTARGPSRLHGTAAVKLPDEIRKEPVPLEFEEGGSFSLGS